MPSGPASSVLLALADQRLPGGDFQLSTNATALNNGTWTDYNGLDLLSANLMVPAAGAVDGNTNFTSPSFTITGLSIANGATFWIRWNEFDISPGADDGPRGRGGGRGGLPPQPR